ncbi:hypothetical protein B566_EDAN001783 [Ephemera danica]|nr:hypothetical protein B566_EDAN001783 [Ephemera danica]
MEEWLRLSLLLCTFGFFKEIRPSEPYVTHYLVGPWKNLTEEQVYEEIYPVGTYSTLALLVVVFLITDLLRYKPIIIAEGFLGIAIWSLLIWAQGVPLMQLVQVLYGGFMAAEVAYYTYIYAKVDKDKFQAVSGHTRAAYLMGRFVSSVAAQALVSTETMDYKELNYITLGAMFVATAWAFLLPPVQSSLYFHRSEGNAISNTLENQENSLSLNENATEFTLDDHIPKTWRSMAKNAFRLMTRDLLVSYSHKSVIKWSLWWALATCGYYQVLFYTQLLWEDIIANSEQNLLNGAVEATYTILGALCALGIGTLHFNWSILGTPILAICAVIQSGALYVSAYTSDLYTAYACYIICLVAYQALATIASSEIAKKLNEDSYALIFGMNMFLALVLQSILTLIVLSWLKLEIREQFVVYASYFAFLAILFIILTFVMMVRTDWSKVSRKTLWLSEP